MQPRVEASVLGCSLWPGVAGGRRFPRKFTASVDSVEAHRRRALFVERGVPLQRDGLFSRRQAVQCSTVSSWSRPCNAQGAERAQRRSCTRQAEDVDVGHGAAGKRRASATKSGRPASFDVDVRGVRPLRGGGQAQRLTIGVKRRRQRVEGQAVPRHRAARAHGDRADEPRRQGGAIDAQMRIEHGFGQVFAAGPRAQRHQVDALHVERAGDGAVSRSVARPEAVRRCPGAPMLKGATSTVSTGP